MGVVDNGKHMDVDNLNFNAAIFKLGGRISKFAKVYFIYLMCMCVLVEQQTRFGNRCTNVFIFLHINL